jgi:hypothetical protein
LFFSITTQNPPPTRHAFFPRRHHDTNSDGKLSRDELPAGLFERLDLDKDGFVSEAELTALWKR